MSEFLAEARILVRPDTTKFRAELEAQLRTAVGKAPVVVPVTAAFAGTTGATTQFAAAQQAATGAATAFSDVQARQNALLGRGAVLLDASAIASERGAAASEIAGAAKARDAVSTRALSQQQVLAAAAAQKLAFTQVEVAGASSEVAAAQVILTRSTAAVAAAEKALGAALNAKNIALIDAAAGSVRLAQSQALEAESALAAARAQATHASSLANVQKAGIASSAGLLGLRGAVLTAGAGFIGATVAFQAGIKAIQSAARLETELNVFRVTVGATSEEMARAAENAKALGRDLTLPGVTAGDAAEAQLQLARAGLEVQDAISGTRGVLQLATAAQIEFGRSADLVAGNLNAFGLAGADAVRVADLLTGAANESQGSIEDMGIGLRQVAGAASLLGLTVEDTVTLLTQLTRAGLAGSDAGTTLRVALVRLARPDTRAEVEKLVGSLEDLNGNLDPRKIVKLGEEIAKSGGKLDRTNKLYKLFGENALRVVGLLANEGVAGFDALNQSVTETGLAAETSGARMEGFSGQVENLKNQMDALGLVLAQEVIPQLGAYTELIADVVRRQTDVTRSNIETAQSAKGLGERFISFATGSDTAGAAVGDFAEKAAGLGARMQFLGPVTLAASLAIDKFARGTDKAAPSAAELAAQVGAARDAFDGLARDAAAAAAVSAGGSGQDGLNPKQILNRVAGFDAEEVRARISGDTNELLGVLQDEQAFLEAQLDRAAVKNRPALRRRLEQALLGSTNDIAAISGQAAAEKKRVAGEVASTQRDADRAFLELLGSRREDISNSAEALAAQGNLQGAIKLLDTLQAIIKQQITRIRTTIKDEQERAAAIRALRQARNASKREEEALRAQIATERAERLDTIQQLNIDIAIEQENDAAAKRSIQKRIKTLNDRIDAARGDQVKVKQLILEREKLRNQLKDLNKVDEDTAKDRKSAQQFFFEQLQAQQGFASNLLGNLIPRDQTAGLVGVPSPAGQINAESKAAQGRSLTAPTSGQASTTNDILLRILRQLKELNRASDSPEAVYQRKVGSATMDGGGGNIVAM